MKRLVLVGTVVLILSLGTLFAHDKDGKEGKENKEPKIKGSLVVPKDASRTDLASLAKVSFAEAYKTAEKAAGGKAVKAELEEESGYLVYNFEFVKADKTVLEIVVDAGNGKVLAQEEETENPKEMTEKHGCQGHGDEEGDQDDEEEGEGE